MLRYRHGKREPTKQRTRATTARTYSEPKFRPFYDDDPPKVAALSLVKALPYETSEDVPIAENRHLNETTRYLVHEFKSGKPTQSLSLLTFYFPADSTFQKKTTTRADR